MSIVDNRGLHFLFTNWGRFKACSWTELLVSERQLNNQMNFLPLTIGMMTVEAMLPPVMAT
jgi:hypothetical protein